MDRRPAPELPGWLEDQLPFQRYRVEVDDGGLMHVMEQGDGRPVLLVHGNPTWGYLYRRVAAELSGEPFRLIMPDLMGLGFSDRPRVEEHTLENHSRWIGELIDQLELGDVIAVVQDWGGPIGLHALGARRELMTGLVVMNTAVGPPRPRFKPTAFHRFFSSGLGALVTRYLGFPQRSLGSAQDDKKSISGVVARSYRYPLRGKSRSEAVTALVRMVPDSMDHPTVEGLRAVEGFVETYDGPAAIVWGDRDPVLGRLLARVSRMLPQATVTATQAGHFLQEEVPAEIASAIRQVASPG